MSATYTYIQWQPIFLQEQPVIESQLTAWQARSRIIAITKHQCFLDHTVKPVNVDT